MGVFGRWKLRLPLVRSRVSKVLTAEPAHRGIKHQSCSQASRCGPEIMITRSGLDNMNIFLFHTPMTTAEFKLSPGPETPPISSDKKMKLHSLKGYTDVHKNRFNVLSTDNGDNTCMHAN